MGDRAQVILVITGLGATPVDSRPSQPKVAEAPQPAARQEASPAPARSAGAAATATRRPRRDDCPISHRPGYPSLSPPPGGSQKRGRMDSQLISEICQQVYRAHPEVKGAKPKVQPYNGSGSLLIFQSKPKQRTVTPLPTLFG